MDRIINVKVGGNHLSKDNKNAGVKGEANVTYLRITFDEGWDGYAKTVTFFDALGGNPVKRLLTVDLIEDIVNDTRTYITSIPKEPLAITGEMIFIIDGFYGEFVKNENGDYEIAYADKSKRQRSIADKLVVKDAPNTDTAGEPTDPTPTEPEQWQAQIEKIKEDIQQVAISKEETAEYAEAARGSADWADLLRQHAQRHESHAYNYANEAAASAEDANSAANKAVKAITHNPVIIDGYWHVWYAPANKYLDTGVKAQSGSTVWYGDNPPADADVWIDPEGESAYNEIKNYIDEQTEILKSDVAGLQAQINEEAHFRGYVSTNAKIQSLNATPNDFAYSAESGTKWMYDAENGWIDTGKPVPDQLTPASDTTPLINGVASVGQENAYARGDHRHPTDTTREDKANKIQSVNDMTGDDEQYLSANGVLDFVAAETEDTLSKAQHYTDVTVGGVEERVTTNEESIAGALASIQTQKQQISELEKDIEACGDFELIDSGTLAEDVVQLTPTINGQYKELYIFLKMPAQTDVSTNTSKARVRMKIGNINIYDQGNFLTDNYNVGWYMVCTVKAYGTRCYSQVWFGKYYIDDKGAINPFAIYPSTANYNGAVVPHANLNNPYLDSFTVSMASNPAGGRYFPNGTIYELWGVKA